MFLLSFAIVSFLRFSNYFVWIILEPGISFHVYQLGFSSQEFGLFFGTYGLMMVIGQIFLGSLSDKFGRKRVIALGTVIYLISFTILFFSTQFWHFILMSILAGIGFSLVLPAQYAFIGDIVKKPEYRGKVIGIFYAFTNIAGIFGPIFGGYLYLVLEIHFLYLISILVLILNIFLLFFLKPQSL